MVNILHSQIRIWFLSAAYVSGAGQGNVTEWKKFIWWCLRVARGGQLSRQSHKTFAMVADNVVLTVKLVTRPLTPPLNGTARYSRWSYFSTLKSSHPLDWIQFLPARIDFPFESRFLLTVNAVASTSVAGSSRHSQCRLTTPWWPGPQNSNLLCF